MIQENFLVRCGKCGARNRIPQNRLREHPRCGRCHQPLSLQILYPDHIVDASDSTFPGEVLQFPGSALAFVWSPGCGYCRALSPVIDELAKEYSGRIKFVRILMEQNPYTASQFSVQSVPTLLLFKGGRLVNRAVGALPKADLQRQLQILL